jgi:AcrR family transcriptional regulator
MRQQNQAIRLRARLAPREPPARPERRDAAEHRAHILHAARELFSAQGVAATSMAEIARRAGVGQGTLYRRYADKGALCLALLKENADALTGTLDEYARVALEQGSSPLAQLEQLLAHVYRFYEANGPLVAEVWRMRQKDLSGPYTNSFYLHIRRNVSALLQAAITRGECEPLDLPLTAELVLAPLTIGLYRHQRRELGYSTRKIHATMWRLLRDGLAKRGDDDA